MCNICKLATDAIEKTIILFVFLLAIATIQVLCLVFGSYLTDWWYHGLTYAMNHAYDWDKALLFTYIIDAIIVGLLISLCFGYIIVIAAIKTMGCACDMFVCNPLERFMCLNCCPPCCRDPYHESKRRDVSIPLEVVSE